MDRNTLKISEGDHVVLRDRSELPYRRLDHLGVGSWAIVEKVKDEKTSQVFAHKKFHRYNGSNPKRFQEVVQNEIAILRKLPTHKHIVRIWATYTCGPRLFGVILTPVADGGDLACYMQDIADSGLPPTVDHLKVLKRAFGYLASGLAFIHQHTIRHKDIKPANILLHKEHVVYTDFGLAFDASQNDTTSTFSTNPMCTPRYCAPETALPGKRTRMADMFSLGCVFLEMMAVVLYPHFLLDDLADMAYHRNLDTIDQRMLQSIDFIREEPGNSTLIDTIALNRSLIHPDPDSRITAQLLRNRMASSKETVTYFCGDCVPAKVPFSESDVHDMAVTRITDNLLAKVSAHVEMPHALNSSQSTSAGKQDSQEYVRLVWENAIAICSESLEQHALDFITKDDHITSSESILNSMQDMKLSLHAAQSQLLCARIAASLKPLVKFETALKLLAVDHVEMALVWRAIFLSITLSLEYHGIINNNQDKSHDPSVLATRPQLLRSYNIFSHNGIHFEVLRVINLLEDMNQDLEILDCYDWLFTQDQRWLNFVVDIVADMLLLWKSIVKYLCGILNGSPGSLNIPSYEPTGARMRRRIGLVKETAEALRLKG